MHQHSIQNLGKKKLLKLNKAKSIKIKISIAFIVDAYFFILIDHILVKYK